MRALRSFFALAAVVAAGLFGTALLASEGDVVLSAAAAFDSEPSVTSDAGTLDIYGKKIVRLF